MRRFIQILGVIAIIILAALAGGLGMVIYSGNTLDRESKAYVDAAVPVISRDWDKQEFLKRVSPALLHTTDADQLDKYFSLFASLGHLVDYEGSTGDSNMSFNSGSGSAITALYTAKARFENGEAAIRVGLVKRDGAWLINSWNVTPIGPVKPAAAHA